MIEKFRQKKINVPVIVSKNRLSAAKICKDNDDIYYNLSENITISGEADNNIPFNGENIEAKAVECNADNTDILGKCAFKEIHGEFDKNKKIAILDDGFSALNIKKNLNIILLDANIDIFIQNVIPAGILREPLYSLKYADIIVINKCKPESLKNSSEFKKETEIKIRKYNKHCPIFYSFYEPKKLISSAGVLTCADLKGKKALFVCAIGNPEYFYENLTSCGIDAVYKIEFQDHYEYKEKDIDDIKKLSDKNPDAIVITTLKDYVKLKKFDKSDVFDKFYYLDFELKFDKDFFEYIYGVYNVYSRDKNKK